MRTNMVNLFKQMLFIFYLSEPDEKKTPIYFYLLIFIEKNPNKSKVGMKKQHFY